VRKTVTALFCDLVDSTPLAERLDPEVLRALMRRYFDGMRQVVEEHGGRVDKFIGDAVVAVFGVPLLREDDALRAVRAASDMRLRLTELNGSLREEWSVELQARIGVCTGEVVVAIGDEVLLGDVLNTAARLEQAAAPGEILVAELTHRLIGHALTGEPLEIELKGKRAPVVAWRVHSINPRAGAVERTFDHSLVGRERELRMLTEAFERTVDDGRSGLVTVLGAPGMGKSRLALELWGALATQATVLVGSCEAYGDGITYAPVAAMVRQAAVEPGLEGLQRLLADQPDGADIAARVAGVVGETPMVGAGAEAFWAVRRLFETVAQERPLVLVFEDIHWAEPTLLELIEYLADWVRDRPLMLLCMARPELLEHRPAWGGGKTNAMTILLDGLTAGDVDRLVDERLGDRRLTDDQRVRIAEAAHGVPLFVEQLLAMMDAGELTEVSEIPPAIHALLAARIEALAPDDRALLEAASVEGESFHAGPLASDDDLSPVLGGIDRLIRRELVRRERGDDQRFRFAHALVRDAAYGRLSKRRRAAAHEHLAGWLAAHGSGEEVVGYHLEQAYLLGAEVAMPDDRARRLARRGSELLESAARRAYDRADRQATANLIQRAVDLRAAEDPDRLRMLPFLAETVADTDLARADSIVAEAIDRASADGDERVLWEARALRSRISLYLDPGGRPMTEMLDDADEVISQLRRLGADSAVASALLVWFDLEWLQGRMSGYERLAVALDADATNVALRAAGYMAGAVARGLDPAADAERVCRELIQRRDGDRASQAAVADHLGLLEAMQGRIDEGRRRATQARDVLAEMGNTEWAGITTLTCGYIEVVAGDVAAAEREFARAAAAFDGLGDTWFLSTAAVDRGLALCDLGRHAEARRVIDRPRADYDVEWLIKRNRALALAALAEGDPAAARERADAAVAAAMTTEYLAYTADALLDRAAVHEASGERDAARADLETAGRLYQRKGHQLGCATVRDRLSIVERSGA
jgi:class 3 adenylate cyclase